MTDHLLPQCTYPESVKCNLCGTVGHVTPACSRRQVAQMAQQHHLSTSSPLSTPPSQQLTIAYDCGSHFSADGAASVWPLPSSASSSVSSSTRAGAFSIPSNRPTPEMPLCLGPPDACSRGLLVNCMPDTVASQSIVSADTARAANLHICPTLTELRNASNGIMTLLGEADVIIKKAADDRCDTTILDRFTKINTDSFDGNPKHIQKAETTIYTDGSKTDHGVGAGFVIYHKNKRIHTESIHLPGTSTVFQAKIEAISHACQYALANLKEWNINYIKILSDSQAAIKALNKLIITSQSVLTTLEFMETLALEVKNLTLAWIKAHVGTEGNEQADQAAKEGAAGDNL